MLRQMCGVRREDRIQNYYVWCTQSNMVLHQLWTRWEIIDLGGCLGMDDEGENRRSKNGYKMNLEGKRNRGNRNGRQNWIRFDVC